jgi:hypothetical protein
VAILSKRKAIIGWLVYTIAKPMAKRKAKSAVPGKRGGVIAGIVAGIGAVLGGLMFWRKRRSKDEESFQS